MSLFPSMPQGWRPGPGPYGLPYPSPAGMPVPGSFPTPSTSLPPLPLPPWMNAQASMQGMPLQVVPVPYAPALEEAGPAVQFQTAAPEPPTNLPPSALDIQSTISFNPVSSHIPASSYPRLDPTIFVAPHATVLGHVEAGEDVFIGFGSVIRADYGSPFHIGPRSSIQDNVVVHGEPGQFVEGDGRQWSVYLDSEVTCLPNAVLHGPLRVGHNVYIGEGALLHTADIGDDSVIMHGATVTGGVRIPPGRFVAPGQTIWRQEEADDLPAVPTEYREINPTAVQGYVELSRQYRTQLPVATWR